MATSVQYEVEVKDIEYQQLDGKPWLARVYQPKGTGPFPAVIDVHGGAWRNGDRTNNAGVDQALAERGVVVAALDFRQPPEAGYPASVQDINLAIRWLKVNASQFNGSAKVGAWGNSSGGHLVALAGVRPRDSRYAALPLPGHPEIDARLAYVIPGWPVIDPLYRYREVGLASNNQNFISAHQAYWGTEEAMQEGSVTWAVQNDPNPDLPPMLLILKKDDKNHPLPMQEAFVAAYRARGGAIQVEMFDGLPEHGMQVTPEVPESVRAIELMKEFIAAQAWG
ncbi:MAG TPA: alpha/beta hydrolase [Chloroflexota bacterium]